MSCTFAHAQRLSLTLLFCLPACGDGPRLESDRAPEPEHAQLDAVRKAPQGEKVASVEEEEAKAREQSSNEPRECGPTTGRLSDGTCRMLSTRDVGHAQQVMLPSGAFIMGMLPVRHDAAAARSNPAVLWPYQPPRRAEVKSFWIDLHEVRRDEYAKCVEAGACKPAACPEGGTGEPLREVDESAMGRLPQTCVGFAQAQAFCEWKGQRLPTEAEWEYAARGPDGRTHPWGEDVRDELGVALMPAGTPVDPSYFALMGFGSSGAEWTADLHRPDRGLEGFVSASFRDDDGPLAREARSWWQRHACADAGACKGQREPARRVIKGPVPGHAKAAYEQTIASKVAGGFATQTVEGWDEVHAHRTVAFRCAGDRQDNDVEMTLPAEPPAIPYTASHDGLEVFGAVAEAVSKREAKRFCEVLVAPDAAGDSKEDWRLPSRAEMLRLLPVFRGPGPFWTSDGGMIQEGAGWIELEAGVEEALLSRCIRG